MHKHATNHTQQRCNTLKNEQKLNRNIKKKIMATEGKRCGCGYTPTSSDSRCNCGDIIHRPKPTKRRCGCGYYIKVGEHECYGCGGPA